ncbi:putative transporter small subunit [Brevibacterium album]|nr:putative transporter small subunit [Brevibacterium album]
MSAAVLTAYVLVWPILVAGILVTIARGFAKDVKEARVEGRPII